MAEDMGRKGLNGPNTGQMLQRRCPETKMGPADAPKFRYSDRLKVSLECMLYKGEINSTAKTQESCVKCPEAEWSTFFLEEMFNCVSVSSFCSFLTDAVRSRNQPIVRILPRGEANTGGEGVLSPQGNSSPSITTFVVAEAPRQENFCMYRSRTVPILIIPAPMRYCNGYGWQPLH